MLLRSTGGDEKAKKLVSQIATCISITSSHLYEEKKIILFRGYLDNTSQCFSLFHITVHTLHTY